jgi:myo-inositol 2-dehydrogenase/D-chiro-inositol 1-dehydrogenase
MATTSGSKCTVRRARASAENQREANIEIATAERLPAPAAAYDFFMTRYIAAYAAEIAAFVSVITDGAAPSPSGEDGLLALALADAALKSAKEGRTVRVDEILN